MSARRPFLDDGPGERRGVVMLDGRPERLLIERTGTPAVQRLGARVAARVRRIERGLGSAFLNLGEGPDAMLDLTGAIKVVEGQTIEVEITGEARRGKGPTVKALPLDGGGLGGGGPSGGDAEDSFDSSVHQSSSPHHQHHTPTQPSPIEGEGYGRLLRAGPSLADRLKAFAPGEPITEGPLAREAADLAEGAVLAVEHALPGGGSIAIEPTRALTAVDVDLGGRGGGDSKRAAKQANLAAIGETARLLRLKGLGGLVVIDLIGKGHDGAALSAAARAAFAPDEPGVSIGPISRFGTFELSIPRRERPLAEMLLEEDGTPTPLTVALRMLRALEREGRADPGGRLTARCHPGAAAAAAPYINELADRIGPRFTLAPDAALPRDHFDVSAR